VRFILTKLNFQRSPLLLPDLLLFFSELLIFIVVCSHSHSFKTPLISCAKFFLFGEVVLLPALVCRCQSPQIGCVFVTVNSVNSINILHLVVHVESRMGCFGRNVNTCWSNSTREFYDQITTNRVRLLQELVKTYFLAISTLLPFIREITVYPYLYHKYSGCVNLTRLCRSIIYSIIDVFP